MRATLLTVGASGRTLVLSGSTARDSAEQAAVDEAIALRTLLDEQDGARQPLVVRVSFRLRSDKGR